MVSCLFFYWNCFHLSYLGSQSIFICSDTSVKTDCFSMNWLSKIASLLSTMESLIIS
ncbi:hypothetical protein Lalb_Chr19g0124961 [Lupinus albus]|uniref:Uncharacterized protein n=1 Tax=Lupinus albus TaxID=3870 RepID=A0A6A4NRE1_LUPAL|nr:hypothetical protein Lalb_Chr19g0124961 [Lupinus albus]